MAVGVVHDKAGVVEFFNRSVVGSDEAAPSNSQTIKLLVDEKTHSEVPGKAHKGPKPVWAEQVTEREEQEPNEHGKGPRQVQEAVEFLAH